MKKEIYIQEVSKSLNLGISENKELAEFFKKNKALPDNEFIPAMQKEFPWIALLSDARKLQLQKRQTSILNFFKVLTIVMLVLSVVGLIIASIQLGW